jgi:hypothetical protein
MKSKYFLYITLVLIPFLSACEKEIEFKGDLLKPKLVLNGLLMPDSIVKINLTQGRFFLDNDGPYKNINNAIVELWKDGNKIENLSSIGEGYYVGSYVPKIGDNIRITATCDGFDPIECSTGIVIPSPVIAVDTMNYREEKHYYYIYDDGSYYTDSSFYYLFIGFETQITFQDPKDIPNYYHINVFIKYHFSNGDSLLVTVWYVSDDLVFQTGNDLDFLEDNNYMKSTLFTDELFDGKEYKLKLKTNVPVSIGVGENPYSPEYENPELVGMDIIVELQSLSHAYYMYLKTCEANFNLKNSFMEYFAEPVQIYSNVKGGIGILGSYSSSIYTISIE